MENLTVIQATREGMDNLMDNRTILRFLIHLHLSERERKMETLLVRPNIPPDIFAIPKRFKFVMVFKLADVPNRESIFFYTSFPIPAPVHKIGNL